MIINDSFSYWSEILFGVSQGSILGSLELEDHSRRSSVKINEIKEGITKTGKSVREGKLLLKRKTG